MQIFNRIRDLMRKHGFTEAADNLSPMSVSDYHLKVWEKYDEKGILAVTPNYYV